MRMLTGEIPGEFAHFMGDLGSIAPDLVLALVPGAIAGKAAIKSSTLAGTNVARAGRAVGLSEELVKTVGQKAAQGVRQRAALNASAAVSGASGGLRTMGGTLDSGHSDATAVKAGLVSGLITFGMVKGMGATGVESLFVGGQAKEKFGAFLGRTLFKEAPKESFEEIGDTAFQHMLVEIQINPNATIEDLAEGLYQSGKLGFIAPVAVGAVTKVTGSVFGAVEAAEEAGLPDVADALLDKASRAAMEEQLRASEGQADTDQTGQEAQPSPLEELLTPESIESAKKLIREDAANEGRELTPEDIANLEVLETGDRKKIAEHYESSYKEEGSATTARPPSPLTREQVVESVLSQQTEDINALGRDDIDGLIDGTTDEDGVVIKGFKGADSWVEVEVPVADIEGAPAVLGEDTYAGMDTEAPPVLTTYKEGRGLLLVDGRNRVAAARKDGKTTVTTFMTAEEYAAYQASAKEGAEPKAKSATTAPAPAAEPATRGTTPIISDATQEDVVRWVNDHFGGVMPTDKAVVEMAEQMGIPTTITQGEGPTMEYQDPSTLKVQEHRNREEHVLAVEGTNGSVKLSLMQAIDKQIKAEAGIAPAPAPTAQQAREKYEKKVKAAADRRAAQAAKPDPDAPLRELGQETAPTPAPKERVSSKKFVEILSDKSQQLDIGFGQKADNYTTADGVEITIKDGGDTDTLLELNGNQVQGDITLDVISMKSARGEGKASKELDKILAEADSRDMAVDLDVDPASATLKGEEKGLSAAELKKWYERKGFIFKGLRGYRPRKSEDANRLIPERVQINQTQADDIAKKLNEDPDLEYSSPSDLFEGFTSGGLKKGYYDGGDGFLYHYDGSNRPKRVDNSGVSFDYDKGKFIVKVKDAPSEPTPAAEPATKSERQGGKETIGEANARLEKEQRKPRKVKGRKGAAGRAAARENYRKNSVIAAIIDDNGGLISASRMKKEDKARFERLKGEYDGAVKMRNPIHNIIYTKNKGKGLAPDQMAQALFGDNKISAPDVDVMWEAIRQAAEGHTESVGGEAKQAENQAQEIDFDEAARKQDEGEAEIAIENLVVGMTFTIDGEEVTVTSVRLDESGEVEFFNLEDGARFGRQIVRPDEAPLWVEELVEPEQKYDPDDPFSTPPPAPKTDAKTEPVESPYSVNGLMVTYDLTRFQAVVAKAVGDALGAKPDVLYRGGTPGEGALDQFAGEKANVPQFMRDSLETAKAMAAAGKSSAEIRSVTGWFPGKYDGKMRWEIPDGEAALSEGFNNLPETKGFERGLKLIKGTILLEDALDHPELFKAYPELAGVRVTKQSAFMDIFGATQGWFNPATNTLNVTPNATDPLSTILHEVQHWIQEKEGFAKGSNPETAVKGLTPQQKKKVAEKMAKSADDLIVKNGEELTASSRVLETVESMDRAAFDQAAAMATEATKRFMDLAKVQEPGSPERMAAYEELKKAEEEKLKAAGVDPEKTLSDWDYAYKIKTATSSSDLETSALKRHQTVQADILNHASLISNAGNSDADFQKAVKAFGLGHEIYTNVAGEIEARDVQARAKMTPEQLKATEPYSSENISKEDSVVLFQEPETKQPPVSPEQTARHTKLEAKHNAGTITPEETAEAEKLVEEAAGVDTALWDAPSQAITSSDTSINDKKTAATFTKVKFAKGGVNADIGGGRFDNATELLKTEGVRNVIFDPFNRQEGHNRAAAGRVRDGQADTTTVNNVLNVIQDAANRDKVIRQAANAVKTDGTSYFLIYQGDGSGAGRATSKGWQENRKTRDYIGEIKAHYGDVKVKNGIIEASNPIKGRYATEVYYRGDIPVGLGTDPAISEVSDFGADKGQLRSFLRDDVKTKDLRYPNVIDRKPIYLTSSTESAHYFASSVGYANTIRKFFVEPGRTATPEDLNRVFREANARGERDSRGDEFFDTKQTVSYLTPEEVDLLVEAGYDSAAGIIDGKSGIEIAVFHQGQIKSADPFTGVPLDQRFNPESPSILYQDAPEFYSTLTRALEGLSDIDTIREPAVKGRSFPAKTIKGKDGKVIKEIPARSEADKPARTITPRQTIERIFNESGVKPEEIKWTGIMTKVDELAAKNDGKVPIEELQKWLEAEGQVKLEEVNLGEPSEAPVKWEQDRQETLLRRRAEDEAEETDENAEEIYDRITRDASVLSETMQEARNEWEEGQRDHGLGETKFSDQTLPGGTNYRETVLTMPKAVQETGWAVVRKKDGKRVALTRDKAKSVKRAEELMLEPDEYDLVTMETSEDRDDSVSYTSSHFPDTPNYVAHMRRADHGDGTLVEELQSDRHQKGREDGYFPDKPTKADFDRWDNEVSLLFPPERNAEQSALAEKIYAWTEKDTAAVPDAPYRQSRDWGMAMFKRALRDAVLEGKTWIGWTDGETQSDRYDLSKHVSAISYKKDGEGTYHIIVKGHVSEGVLHEQRGMTLNELSNYLGKDVATRISNEEGTMFGEDLSFEEWTGADQLANADESMMARYQRDYDSRSSDQFRDLKGDGLSVGGSGMKGFYDDIMPNQVGKYVKQWGAKVEKSELEIMGTNGETGEKSPIPITEIWKVQITPEMAAEIKAEGQPLFQDTKGPQPKGSMEVTETGKIILRGLQSPDFTTAVHELAHAARRHLDENLTPEEIKEVEAWAGAEGGKWNRNAEERWARGWEKYFKIGKAPTAVLQPIFDQIAGWMSAVYKNVKGSAIDVDISPEVQKIFDKLASKIEVESPTTKSPPTSPEAAAASSPTTTGPAETTTAAAPVAETQTPDQAATPDRPAGPVEGEVMEMRGAKPEPEETPQASKPDVLTPPKPSVVVEPKKEPRTNQGDISFFDNTVKALPEEDQKIFIDRYHNQKPISQIAQEQGKTTEEVQASYDESLKIVWATMDKRIRETSRSDYPIGLAKADIEERREREGRQEILNKFKMTNEESMDEAERILKEDPLAGTRLVEAVLRGERKSATSVEEAILLLEVNRLELAKAKSADAVVNSEAMSDPSARLIENKKKEALARRAEAIEDKVRKGEMTAEGAIAEREAIRSDLDELNQGSEDSSPQSKADERIRWLELESQISDLEKASRKLGSAAGRALQFLRRMIQSDYSLAGMLQKARVAKGGPLTKDQADSIEELSKDWEEKSERTEKGIEDQPRVLAKAEYEKIIAGLKKENAKVKRQDPIYIKWLKAKKDKSAVDSAAASQRLKARLGRLSANPFGDIPIISDLAIMAYDLILGGIVKPAEISLRLVRDFGDTVKPYTDKAIARAKKMLNKDLEANPAPKKTKKTEQEEKSSQEKLAAFEELIMENSAEGDPLLGQRPIVLKYVRELIASGVVDESAITASTLSMLLGAYPDIDSASVEDLISNYGEYTEPTKNTISKRLAQLKQQLLPKGKIRDIRAGVPPKKTGKGVTESNSIARIRNKEVRDLMRKHDFDLTDPARQLASSRAATMTRLQHEIDDMNSAIADNVEMRTTENAAQIDPVIEWKKKERDAKRAEYDAIFGPEAKRRKGEKAVEQSLDVQIKRIDNDLENNRLYPDPKSPPYTNAQIKAKRKRRDELKEELNKARKADEDATTDTEKQAKREEQALDRAISRAEHDLEMGKLYPKSGPLKPVNAVLIAKRAILDHLRAEKQNQRNLNELNEESKRQDAMMRSIFNALHPEIEKKPGKIYVESETMHHMRQTLREIQEARKRSPEVAEKKMKDLENTARKRIKILEAMISGQEVKVKRKPKGPVTEEVADLQAEVARLNREVARMRNAKTPAEIDSAKAERMKKREDAAEARIKELKKMIETKVIETKKKTPSEASERLQELQKQRAELTKVVNSIRREQNPRALSEEARNHLFRTRTLASMADMESRIASGKLKKEKAPPLRLTKENKVLLAEQQEVKARFGQELYKIRLQGMSKGEMVSHGITSGASFLAGASRTIMTSGDMSALLRQGGLLAMSHPLIAAESVPRMLGAISIGSINKGGYEGLRMEIEGDENFNLMESAGLEFTWMDSDATHHEELFAREAINRIWGLKQSGQSFTAYLNVLRLEAFNAVKAKMESGGKYEMNMEDATALAHYINVSTGRVGKGKLFKSVVSLLPFLFSPQLTVSRFMMLGLEPLVFHKMSRDMRVKILQEYTKTLGSIGIILTLATIAGAAWPEEEISVSYDISSADFLKIRHGDSRYDPLAGLQQATRFFAATGASAWISHSGRKEMWGFENGRVWDMKLFRFGRSKLNPLFGAGWSAISGEDWKGDPIPFFPKPDISDGLLSQTFWDSWLEDDIASGLLCPMILSDALDTLNEDGLGPAVGIAIANFFGLGAQRYPDRRKNRKGVGGLKIPAP